MSLVKTTATLCVITILVGSICGVTGLINHKAIKGINIAKRETIVSAKPVNVTTKAAQFGQLYTSNVRHRYMMTYVYKLTPEQAGKAIRVHVSTPDATNENPVLFVVKEQKDVISWKVPLLLENTYPYYNVSRTLCPTGNIGNDSISFSGEFSIDVSTMSPTSVTVMLKAEAIDIDLSFGEVYNTSLNPSEPKFMRFNFPGQEDTVVVKMRSDDEMCMVLSIQNIKCPIYDLTRNVEFTGFYQTVDKRGAITVRKTWFPEGEFFVVLVVKPADYDCNGIESIHRPGEGRIKNLQLFVEPDITTKQYIVATTTAAAWFFMFYVIALVISCVYHHKERSSEGRSLEPITEAIVPPEQRTLLPGGARSPTGEEGTTIYGATSTSNADTSDGTYTTKRNGIPHRIPPPEENSSDISDIDDREVDMLHDVDQEKDVFRTKTFLYVTDLARKPRKALAKKYKLYTWNIITIAVFYGLPVIQLVITYQKVLNVTGNEDICYYNFDCAHRVGVISAFNNVYSNIGYTMLGLLFLILVYRRDMYHRKLVEQNDRYEKHYGIPQHFGLFYAVGIALAMEGVLSACYHVCPSYSNFQFDTSFMYMIAWLCMLKIYQTRHPDINAHAHVAYFAIAVVIFLAVLGVFSGNIYYFVIFAVIEISTCVVLSLHVYYMGRWRVDMGVFQRIYLLIKTDRFQCIRPMYMDRMILLIIGNIANWSLAICGVLLEPKDFASYLLAIFMVNLLMYFAFYIIMKLRSKERILPLPLMYIVLATIVWGGAAFFFFTRITSWELMPARSRDSNQDCMLFGFYDSHDIWHFLSAMSMFFGFMVLLTLDDDLIHIPRDRIPVF